MEYYIKLWNSKSYVSSQTSPLNEKTNHVEVECSNSEEEVLNQVESTHVKEIAEVSLLINEVDITSLPVDPVDRKLIILFHPNIHDAVRRHYILKSPCQPRMASYPKMIDKDKFRQFNSSWFDLYPNWLEYSMKKDVVFCLPSYLFQAEKLGLSRGDVFSTRGFNTWKNAERLGVRIGGPSSMHSHCSKMCFDLMNLNQSIQTTMEKQTKQLRTAYQTRLNVSTDVARFLLTSGSAFRGHDESQSSNKKGNFLSLLEWLAKRTEKVGDVVLRNAPKNLQMTSPKIQKDIVNACASKILKAIVKDNGDDYFALLVDESRDVSHKEQMELVIRYADRRGFVIERLVGIVHVKETTIIALKDAVYYLLLEL